MLKKNLVLVIVVFLCFPLFSDAAVKVGEQVRIHAPIQFFEITKNGTNEKSFGIDNIWVNGTRVLILEVKDTEELDGIKGNWCRFKLRHAVWNEDGETLWKGTECWGFIPEDCMIFWKE